MDFRFVSVSRLHLIFDETPSGLVLPTDPHEPASETVSASSGDESSGTRCSTHSLI
jgi:hypothetical protein